MLLLLLVLVSVVRAQVGLYLEQVWRVIESPLRWGWLGLLRSACHGATSAIESNERYLSLGGQNFHELGLEKEQPLSGRSKESISSVLLHVEMSLQSSEHQPKLTPISFRFDHGEGPHWDEDRQVLFFVDLTNQTVNRYDPSTKETTQVALGGDAVTMVIPVKYEDRYVVARDLDIVVFSWDGKSPKPSDLRVLASVESNSNMTRFNDAKVDNSGRLWAGTMGPEDPEIARNLGSLYSFDPVKNFRPVTRLSPVSLSNGMAWNRNDTLMYFIDSHTNKIDVFDFDLTNGKMSNRRTLYSFDQDNISGFPDGMTIDENENLWVAAYNGSAVLNIDTKTGKLLRKIDFPMRHVTSCMFGGPRLDVLFVTTSKKNLSPEEVEKYPLAGYVFKVTGLGVKGQSYANKVTVFSPEDFEEKKIDN